MVDALFQQGVLLHARDSRSQHLLERVYLVSQSDILRIVALNQYFTECRKGKCLLLVSRLCIAFSATFCSSRPRAEPNRAPHRPFPQSESSNHFGTKF